MQEATLILEILKSKNIYPQETLALLLRIEAMKKEIYDIQTVDLRAKKTIVPFNPAEISPIGIFEYGKKINLIGKA